jgi:3-oxoacyl-[acyl-carrier protein] reductase
MTKRLSGRTALVIGAARGIGAGIAERFADEGAGIVIADSLEAEGTATAKRLNGRFVAVDVSEKESVEAAVAEAVNAYGGLDILVQNAGIYPWTLIEDTSPEEWTRVLAVNLGGCFNAASAALPAMKAQGSGRMLFTSSITGPHVTSPGHGHLAAPQS